MKHNLRKDVVPGALFLILGVVLWVLTPSQIRTSETSFFTARTFPYIVLGIIILCSAALLVSGVVRVLAERRAQRGDTHAEAPAEKNVKMLLLVAGLVIACVAAGRFAGLLVAGLLLTAGFLVIYGDKKPLHYVVVLVTVTVFYYLFKLVFGLNLP